MEMNQAPQVEELTDWINIKLRFIDAIIKEARLSRNYGKETQYRGMREAYLEFLNKLGSEQQLAEQAAA